MSLIKYKTYTDDNFDAWKHFHDKAYGKNHILTDREHLNWYLGNWGHKTITAWDHDSMVGVYGALPAKLRVKNKHYSFCWFVSGIVLPKYRGQGIGKTFVRKLLEVFDICGVIGFNPGVRRNYERFGFKQFDYKTLRRFAMVLDKKTYSIVNPEYNIESILPVFSNHLSCSLNNIYFIDFFKDFDLSCIDAIEENHKVNIVRDKYYLNWRYFENPRIIYECIVYVSHNKILGYIVSRHERFYPSDVYATRIIDISGKPFYVKILLKYLINYALKRNDVFIDFSFTGNFYKEIFEQIGFIELRGDVYGALPLVSSPVEYRENEEFICLGSKKHPELFKDIEFDDLYFTRGDADRDRAN